MLPKIELAISSNYVNVFNFLVFDVVLISLLYLLTADLMGRLNDVALDDKKPHLLIIASPPVLGGGLCTTYSKRTQILLMLARLVGIGLILTSNLTIQGGKRFHRVPSEMTVVARGNPSHVTDVEEFSELQIIRSGCQGSRPPTEKEPNSTIVYYGDLRVNHADKNKIECITDRRLLNNDTIVEFATQIDYLNVTTGQGCTSFKSRLKNGVVMGNYRCPHATISCVFFVHDTELTLDSCKGLLRHEGQTYMSEEGAVTPDMEKTPSHVQWIKGIDFRDTFWLNNVFFHNFILKDILDVAYASRREQRTVLVQRTDDVTFVRQFWFAALALKVLLVAFFGLQSMHLQRKGYYPVVNDEKGLAGLLITRIAETSLHEYEVGDLFLTAERSADGLLVSTDLRPRDNSPCASQGGAPLRRNLEVHRLEARYI